VRGFFLGGSGSFFPNGRDDFTLGGLGDPSAVALAHESRGHVVPLLQRTEILPPLHQLTPDPAVAAVRSLRSRGDVGGQADVERGEEELWGGWISGREAASAWRSGGR
jgi:hypothetical protein